MAASLVDAIHAVQTAVLGIGGIRAAPDYPPEQMNVFPFVIAFPGAGTYTPKSSGWSVALHDIIVQIHIPRVDLPNATKTLMPFVESIPAAFMADPTFGGKIQTFEYIERSQFTAFEWGDTKTFGISFTIRGAKLHM